MARREDPKLGPFEGVRVFDGTMLFRARDLYKGRGAKQAAKAKAAQLRKRRGTNFRVTKRKGGYVVWEMIGRGL